MGIGTTLFLTSIIFASMFISADALSRSDIDSLKSQIDDARAKIIDYDAKIAAQKETVSQKEADSDAKREVLRDTKSKANESWDALKNIESVQKEYDNSLKEVKNAKDQLTVLLNEKNSYVRMIKDLEKEIPKVERELKRAQFKNTDITKLVGIQLSNSCLNMIKNDIPNNCPTYEQLAELDTSRQEVSGYFVSEPYYHREITPVKNSWRYYDSDPTPRIIVDPPNGMAQRIHMIFIQPNQEVYFTIEDMTLSNSTRTWHEHRYIEDCKRAFINSGEWERILVDTIYTLHNGCTDTTLSELNFEIMPFTDLPIDQTASWKYNKWVENSKEKCKEICKEY